MLYRKIMQSSFLFLLIGVLFTVNFTSMAAPIAPLEEVHPIATANPANDSAVEVVAIAEKAIEAGIEKVEEEKEKEKAEFERKKRLLAALIFCEAGNQPYKGQVAVGAVVMNRIESSRYPNTIDAVIFQKGQFTPALNGKVNRVLNSGSYTSTSLQAAEDALNGVDPVEGCLYFGCGKKGIKIGAHYFH